MKTVHKISTLIVNCILIFQANSFLVTSQEKSADKDLQDLVEAEKAFAATTVKEGFRDGFIKFFADDGIGFGPNPEKTKEVLLKTPPTTAPRTLIFNWQPMVGDISLAGDMGYTTGPVLFTDITMNPRPPRHGIYFSVWQKQADGSWKVAIDMGVDTPKASGAIDVGFTRAKNPNPIGKSEAEKLGDGNFNTLDEEFSADIEKLKPVKAYEKRLSEEFRIHRNGMMPVITKAALIKYLESRDGKLSFKTLGGKIAKSKDLAFTYGSFNASFLKNGKEENQKGFYVHVWRRDKSSKWKLTVDVLNEVPRPNSNAKITRNFSHLIRVFD